MLVFTQSTMPAEPSLPPFDHVRLATLNDLPRVATVAAAGFFWSPTFQFQRPYYAAHPEDTIASYFAEYQAAIHDPASVVIVAEDSWNEDERASVYEALRRISSSKPKMTSSGKVVVGVCSINLKPGSRRVGQFQTVDHVDPPERDAVQNMQQRDQCPKALEIYSKATAPAKTKYLAGQMRLSTLAVHPAYWRKGHATKLVSFVTRLADMDDLPVGVSAAPMGATVAAKAGFEEQEIIRIKRPHYHQKSSEFGTLAQPDGPAFGDVELWVGIRQPSSSPSEGSTTEADSPTTNSVPLYSSQSCICPPDDLLL
ncbi:hypothetical protein K469DRAFT_392320 [Zopfia rhizophila CBS 207.26]|uniref:N-acetyltransferase domain-containing protein n=1 Tax=Zopfia rhizophila CBS 207.26 TaxID=1314779 RepID=A0A6A6EGY0_9PEZI|nr:hypothetical protein K469DRAFT_392320 [Zopfia rhizophila CBS 207.26]